MCCQVVLFLAVRADSRRLHKSLVTAWCITSSLPISLRLTAGLEAAESQSGGRVGHSNLYQVEKSEFAVLWVQEHGREGGEHGMGRPFWVGSGGRTSGGPLAALHPLPTQLL